MSKQLLLGQTLGFSADPFSHDIDESVQYHRQGAVLIEDGVIQAVGDADDLRAVHRDARITDYGKGLISAGFVDCHVHYPQTAIIASWGKRLLDWLNSYTFPEESRFFSAEYAQRMAETYFSLILSHGITSACSYCTVHPESVDAFFHAAQKRNMRMFAGKTCMDRHAPDNLMDTPQSAYDDSEALLNRWHGVGRNHYVITPRFSPTSSAEQLEAMGALWKRYPDCLMQSHLSEQKEEVKWVKSLFPMARDYLESYEMFGLLGEGAVFGHAIWLEERERARLLEVNASLAHCPTSNSFIGSGLFAARARKSEGHRVGLATDTGGGSSFSMLRTMAAAYEIGQLQETPLHPAQLYWLATQGSAQALLQGHRIGNLGAGMDADLIVLDLASTPDIAQREARAENFWESVFPTIMMGDDRAIDAVWIAGKSCKIKA